MPAFINNNKNITQAYSLTGYRLAGILLLFSTLLNSSPAKSENAFIIQSAQTEIINQVYHLNASINYHFSDEAISALKNGVPLIISLDINVTKERNWWWDDEVAHLEQGYLLIYHALSKNYIIHNLNSGVQKNYVNLRTALHSLGNIRRLPVMDASLLEPGSHYSISIRTHLDIESLPAPMRPLAYISDEWKLQSDWYSWSLQI